MASRSGPRTPSRIDAILAFWADHAEGSNRHDSQDAVKRLIERDPTALLTATVGESLAGTLIVGWDGWRFHLYRLAVRSDLRRRGVGRALLAAAEERAAEVGALRIDAMVLDDNDLGRSIWAAAGYQQQAEWSRWVKAITAD
jgi:ribosomal protein S18 acetylase RimI-like enzyme